MRQYTGTCRSIHGAGPPGHPSPCNRAGQLDIDVPTGYASLMAHATHFLERLERLSPSETDLALTLYRDPDLIEFLLERIRLPEAERIALALDDSGTGPHIIVTRSGQFVTCLGAGMTVGAHPIVARHAMDRVIDKFDGARTALESGAGASRELQDRFFHANIALAREDFRTLTAIMPLMADVFVDIASEMSRDVVANHTRIETSRIKKLTPRIQKMLRIHSDLTWSTSAVAMLLSERRDDVEAMSLGVKALPSAAVQTLATACMIVGYDTGILLRASRAISSMGPDFIGYARDRLRAASDPRHIVVSATALCAIGLRYPRKEREVTKIIREYPGKSPFKSPRALGMIEGYLGRLLDNFDPEKRAAMADEIRRLGAEQVVDFFGSVPGMESRFPTVDSVPEDIALGAYLRFSEPLIVSQEALEVGAMFAPWVAHPDPSVFFLPAELEARIPVEVDYEVAALLPRLGRRRADPARAEKSPGRNDPCSCGSGKKYKRCCGAAE